MKNERTALYRHFDTDGRLLYVGISNDTLRRLCQHKERSHWFEQIARVDIEFFDSRDDALAAESAAIANESPAFNIRLGFVRSVHPGNVARVDRGSFGVMHLGTGLIDGWYSDRDLASSVLGWFRAAFPRDRFALLAAKPGAGRAIGLGHPLRPSEWELWAASQPDWDAADRYELGAA